MRIAFNGLFLREPFSGTGEYLRRLLTSLAQMQADQLVVIAPSGVDLPAGLGSVEIHHYADGAQNFGPNLAKVWFEQVVFPRACESLKADVAHVPHWGSPLAPSVPTVVTVHDVIPLVLPAYRGSTAVRFYTRLVAASARRARAVIADSVCSARDITARLGIAAEKVNVIYLAVDETFGPRSFEEQEALRSRLGLPPDFLLYLGGFDLRKNLVTLMAALVQVRLPGFLLALAGAVPERDTPLFPHPLKLARERGVAAQVRLVGLVSEGDKPALYSAARGLLYPSRYEGFGLPPLEAMACGTPVAVSSGGSLPEVVGEAGLVIPPDHAAGWTEAIRRLWIDSERRKTLRARGLAQARRFSWGLCARQTRRVYEAVKHGNSQEPGAPGGSAGAQP